MNDVQKSVLSRSIKIRLDRGEDAAEIFKSYKNLTGEEKASLLGEYGISPYPLPLDEVKKQRIDLSNSLLASYIQDHPLVTDCHGNKMGTYTITEEKRNMFTSKYTAHMALTASGIEDVMTWNESGQPCEPWTEEECIRFLGEWNAVSAALVSYQQRQELSIRAAETEEAVMAVALDFSSADPRNHKIE